MSDYTLYYWSVPFRGQFVRAVLAHAGKIWDEGGDDAIAKLMGGPVKKIPVPFMGPPLLIAPTNSEPRIGPVHEKETIASVNAIKNIPPRLPKPDFESALLASELGRVISKKPKNEMAKRRNITKKKRFNHTLVEMLFNICGDALNK